MGQRVETPGSMFVWIPRYAYKITNNTVEIEFLYGNTNNFLSVTEVITTNEDGTEKTDYVEKMQDILQKEGYRVHPSFTNGENNNYANGEWDKEIEGFWAAKYVAGYQSSTITYDANGQEVYPEIENIIYSNKTYTSYNNEYTQNALGQNISSTSYSTQKISYPVFKPLTYAYNLISVGDSYAISQEIAKTSYLYGLNSNNTDSHMMKNSEWGAIAYLAHSKYGRNGIEIVANTKNLNNKDGKNIYAVTGYAGTQANGTAASSTNNITGVFDLNGCLWEAVAAYISNGSDILTTNGNLLNPIKSSDSTAYQTNSTKYVTIYPFNESADTSNNNWSRYNELKTLQYGYGDSILETSSAGEGYTSWNNDHSEFAYLNRPFFIRGGSFGSQATNGGTFAFYSSDGSINHYMGFRVVLI